MIVLDSVDYRIVRAISMGLSRPEIAQMLGFKVAKLDYRIQLLYEEFDVHNAAALVAVALRKGAIL